MPSTKKRINLTVPEPVYDKLQVYKEENGITNDASACLQLIIQQLRAQETSHAFLKLVRESSMESLMEMSQTGISVAKEEIAALDAKRTVPALKAE